MPADYLRPKRLADALDAMARGPRVVVAGCTDLFPATERKTLSGSILDVTAIEELRGIARTDSGMRLGATTTWTDVVQAPLPAAFDGLKRAAREVGAQQVQNRGTLAGNLCNASPAADGVPPLLTLDARVELTSQRGQRALPLAEFLLGPRRTARASDELVTAILVPETALLGRGHFLKLGARKYLVISIAMVAVRIMVEEGVICEAALAVGACGPVATRLPDVEAQLIGQPLGQIRSDRDAIAAALSPIDDLRADAAYRWDAAATLIERALRDMVHHQEVA